MTATRRRNAIHEAGHAVVATLRRESGGVRYVSIRPEDLTGRPAGSGGVCVFNRTLPIVRFGVVDRAALDARLAVDLAGVAAEEILARRPFAPIASWHPKRLCGGGTDYPNAMKLARSAIFVEADAIARDANASIAAGIPHDEAIEAAHARYTSLALAMVDRAYADGFQILTAHWAALRALTRALLKHGRLSGDECEALIEATVARPRARE